MGPDTPRRIGLAFVAIAVAALVPALLLALDGGKLGEFFGLSRTAAGVLDVAIAALVLVMPIRAMVRRGAFGQSRADLLHLALFALVGLALAGADTVRMAARPHGRALPILGKLVLLVVELLAVSIARTALEPRGWIGRLARLSTRIAFSGLLIVGAFAALEAWVAAHYPADDYAIVALDGSGLSLHEPDPDLAWKMRPRYRGTLVHPEFEGVLVETNSLGFREREFDAMPSPTLVLGDSFAFGLGVPVEETLARRLERLGVSARVWNAGVSGYGTLDELVLFDRLSRVVAPSRVVVVLYVGNDFEDNFKFLRRHRTPGREAFLAGLFPGAEQLADRIPSSFVPPPIPGFGDPEIARRSSVRRFLETRSRVFRLAFASLARRSTPGEDTSPQLRANAFLVRCFAMEPDAEVALAIEVTVEGLRAIDARARAVGARTLVCIAPAAAQLDPALFRDAIRDAGFDPAHFDVDRVSTVVGARCADAGIDCLDLLPEFRAREAQGERLYFREGHWRDAGHAAAAEAIARHLRTEATPEGFDRR